VHPNQIQDWRRRLLDSAAELFDRGGRPFEETEHKLKELHTKIGQLTMERNFLEQGLERIHGPSARK
jgi:transposase-like protein